MEIEEDTLGANPASVKSDDSSPRTNSGRGSPPPNCAICLGNCKNKSFTDSCLHQFCFSCLLTWSKVKAECPLCKQNFKSIIHNVRSNHQYEEYMVEQRTEEVVERIDISNITQARRFRYRTTLTLPRRDSMAIQRLLLLADVYPPPAPRAPLARRRRSPASFRRTVYRHALWARPLPDFTGRFRDCSPEFYRYNDAQMHRLVPWINRELHYLLNENVAHISYVLTRILELLPQYHINSPEFREALRRYFGDRTEHFLHELYCFASTPYDMPGYDRNVQYTTDPRISTMVNEVISSSDSDGSVDSDIVMVSHSEPQPPPPAAAATAAAGPSRPLPHDNLYGISYNIPDHNQSVIPIETISHSDTDDDSEVMVVGYIKPPQERTPEVVDLLGSDSDVVVQDNPQPGPSQASDVTDNRSGGPLVKLTLKRHVPAESDSDDSFEVVPEKRSRARTHDSPRWSSSSSSSSLWSSPRSCVSTSGSSSSTSSSTSWAYDSSSNTDTWSSSTTSDTNNRRKSKKKRPKIRTNTTRPDKGKKTKSKSQKRKKSQITKRSSRTKNKDRKSKGKKSRVKSSRKTDVSVQCSDRGVAVASTPASSTTDYALTDHHDSRNLNQSSTSEIQGVTNDLSSASFSSYDLYASTFTPLPKPKTEQPRDDSYNELEHQLQIMYPPECSTSRYTDNVKSKSRNHKPNDDVRSNATAVSTSQLPSTSEQFSSETLHTAMDNVLHQPCTSGYTSKIKIKRKTHSNKEIWENETNTSTMPLSPKPSTSEQAPADNLHEGNELSRPSHKVKKRSHKHKSDVDNESRKKNKDKKKKRKRSSSREPDREKSRKHKKRRNSSGENKRLKSVVKLINSNQCEGPSESPSSSNLLNVLSDAILNPNSHLLSYNSDSGSMNSEGRNRMNADLIGRAESCFNLEIPELLNLNRNSQSNETDTDDDLPLNYSLK